MNRNKKFLKALLLLAGAALLPIILHYGAALFELYPALEHPGITHHGDKTVHIARYAAHKGGRASVGQTYERERAFQAGGLAPPMH